jgi:hypothetical protein
MRPMKYLPALLLAVLAAQASITHADEPATSDCLRLAHPGDASIQTYCSGSSRASQSAPAARSCRRFVPQGDTKIQAYCGTVTQWEAFDKRAVDAGVTCRWPNTPEELCLSVAQWESFDRPESRAVDEVIVSATRTLTELRKEIDAAQDRLVAKYNELNQKPEFALSCDREAPTGSRFERHVCRAKFVDDAVGGHSRGFIEGLRGESGGNPALSGAVLMASKKSAFEKNMAALVNQSEELRTLAQTHAGLEGRYERILRNTFGSSE